MIKFFRKIRYDLMEKNKTGKPAYRAGRYFIYAIGEIILVVIGILIALSINNWDESQKQNDKLNQYKNNLITELEKDIKQIDSLTNFRLECKISILNYIEYYNQKLPDIDTLITKKNTMKARVSAFMKSSYTLQELSNTGNISLFNNEEKLAIVELKNIQDKYEQIEKEIINYCTSSYDLLMQESDALYDFGLVTNEHKTIRGWRYNIDAKQYRLLNNHLTSMLDLYQFQDQTYYPKLRKSTLNLIELLNRK